MREDSRINISDEVPLNSTGVTKVYLNTGTAGNSGNTKVQRYNNGPDIHLQKDSNTTDIDLHLNTTLSLKSPKKIKFLFILNFVLSIASLTILVYQALYYWNEISSIKHRMEMLESKLLMTEKLATEQQSSLMSEAMAHRAQVQNALGYGAGINFRNTRLGVSTNEEEEARFNEKLANTPEKKFKEALDSSKSDMFVVQFNGPDIEVNSESTHEVAPWILDKEVSTANSVSKIELSNDSKYFTIHEGGLYLVYAQVAYLSYKPNCFFIWASQYGETARLVSMCGTGSDSSNRPMDKAQMSCSTQAITRLKKGDTVNVSQRENDRVMWLKPGFTHIGFVRLSA